uniref:Uncharacterized protein n=1 Tax=Anguilla anguilla TaxID=7936 RepID=A0A0E9XAM2_ANGAN
MLIFSSLLFCNLCGIPGVMKTQAQIQSCC